MPAPSPAFRTASARTERITPGVISTEPIDTGLRAKSAWLPALALTAATFLAYAMSIWVWRQQSMGGFAWIFPLLVAAGVAVRCYRGLCLRAGVLSNRESVALGRSQCVWVALAIFVVYGLVQKSVSDSLVSVIMGLPIFAALMACGLLAVKTLLLVEEHPERGRDEQMRVEEIAQIQAAYRQQHGIKDLPEHEGLQPGLYLPGSAQPVPQAPVGRPEPLAPLNFDLADLPQPRQRQSGPATEQARPQPQPPRQQPGPSAADEEALRQKIRELRARALKAQRKGTKDQ